MKILKTMDFGTGEEVPATCDRGGDRMPKLTHFSLFTGIGGIDLAAEWAGFESVGQCEWADYPTKVLEKHWPNVPRWRDVRDVTKESVRTAGIERIDLISGGFPCQPFSVAGKQKGKEDNRYLWPEMLRVIRELSPTWVLGENVPGIMSIAGDEVCKDLEREGYEVGIFNFEAAAVGAKHRRERIFFVGYSKHNGLPAIEKLRSNEATSHKRWTEEQEKTGQSSGADRSVDASSIHRSKDGSKQYTEGDVANPNNKRLERRNCEILPECSGELLVRKGCTYVADTNNEPRLQTNSETCTIRKKWHTRDNVSWGSGGYEPGVNWWEFEPDVGRVANGVPDRVDKLRGLGNAVVPQQVYPILKAIADIERGA